MTLMEQAQLRIRELTDAELADGLKDLEARVLGTNVEGFAPFMHEAARRLRDRGTPQHADLGRE